jgi:hypothetical protein
VLRQLRGIPIKVRHAPRSKSWESSSAGPEAEPGGMTKAALYEEARRLGVAGRSSMSRTELEGAVASARRPRRSAGPLARLRDKRMGTVGFLLALKGLRSASLGDRVNLQSLKSLLRTPGPLRAAILSLATLAAGVLGLVVAYGVVPSESVAAQQTNATTLRLVTVTGPEGTTTMAVTKTKQGKTKLVPVRVLRTVTGPGGVSTVSMAIAGPGVTQIREHTNTQVVQNTQTDVVTEVVTEIQPVTVVVTQQETVVVTDTVFVEVTVTHPPGPPP